MKSILNHQSLLLFFVDIFHPSISLERQYHPHWFHIHSRSIWFNDGSFSKLLKSVNQSIHSYFIYVSFNFSWKFDHKYNIHSYLEIFSIIHISSIICRKSRLICPFFMRMDHFSLQRYSYFAKNIDESFWVAQIYLFESNNLRLNETMAKFLHNETL